MKNLKWSHWCIYTFHLLKKSMFDLFLTLQQLVETIHLGGNDSLYYIGSYISHTYTIQSPASILWPVKYTDIFPKARGWRWRSGSQKHRSSKFPLKETEAKWIKIGRAIQLRCSHSHFLYFCQVHFRENSCPSWLLLKTYKQETRPYLRNQRPKAREDWWAFLPRASPSLSPRQKARRFSMVIHWNSPDGSSRFNVIRVYPRGVSFQSQNKEEGRGRG